MLWGIIADDLTGACDTAGRVARRGHRAVVLPDAAAPLPAADIVVLNTDSRFDAPQLAADKVRRAAERLRAAGLRRFYKKLDGPFRGNVGAELDALMDTLGESLCVVTPAFPGQGRALQDGVLYIRGVPLAETDFRHDPFHPALHSNLVQVLAAQTRRPVRVLAAGAPVEGSGYLLADAETDGDLDRLAAACAAQAVAGGGSGFAGALSALLPPPVVTRRRVALPPPCGGVLAVAGSLHPASRRQVAESGARVLGVGTPAAAVAAALQSGDVVLQGPDRLHPGLEREVAEALAQAAAAALARSGGCRLVVLGGETAGAVCRSLGVRALTVVEELEPGVAAVLAPGPLLMILKPGAFGGPAFLNHALQYVRMQESVQA